MDKYLIRDYTTEDYIQVYYLWRETGLWNSERQDDEKSINDCLIIGGKFLVLIDTSCNLIIGSSWMTFDGRRIYLHHFGIKPEYQGKGLGTLLAKSSLNYISRLGYQVKLEVHKQNQIAQHLYKKLGFFGFTDYDILMIREIQNIQYQDGEL